MAELPSKLTPTYERRALILDDNDGNRLLLKLVMQMNALEQAEAETAMLALALWKPGAFSFVFLDIELPDLSGLEVARRMRASDDGVAIIMCSTNNDPRTISTAIRAGCDMFLVKPFHLDLLMTLIKGLDREKMRTEEKVMIIDNLARTYWASRIGVSANMGALP